MIYLFFFAITVLIAGLILYASGYGYLFNGISKTYLKGKLSANIDDGTYFSKNLIETKNPKPWEKDDDYNKLSLPKNIVEDLERSDTASFLVIKDGKLLHEEYFKNYKKTSLTNSFSMAKAVTVMLLGKALEEGKIDSIDKKFSEYFDEFKSKDHAENLTLRHLAQMESGLDWVENYKSPFLPNARAYYGKSLRNATFTRNFTVPSGERFEYQSGTTQLLGFAVKKAVNQTLASYLSEKFWIPLGMEYDAFWSTDQSGMEKTYCCIHATARDFAKLGQLFLNDGEFDGKQVLNYDFINEMRKPTEKSEEIYGMGLWINNDNPIKHYYFLGLQGQYIIMIPEHKMVIVRTGSYQNSPKTDRGRPDQVRFLVNETVKMFD